MTNKEYALQWERIESNMWLSIYLAHCGTNLASSDWHVDAMKRATEALAEYRKQKGK
jgi:hypothetical protein